MGAPTEYYVDPAIAGDSGTGTIGDPFGDLQYALNTVTRDATNGDRFNIKAGTAEVLAATLSLATYGTPTAAAGLWFQGYTSAAGDGGVGDIDGNGNKIISMVSVSARFRHMKLHNTGANNIVSLSYYASIVECELYDTTARPADLTQTGLFANNNVYDFGDGIDLNGSLGFLVRGNYFNPNSGAQTAVSCIEARVGANTISRNVFVLDGATDGIGLWGHGCRAYHNSILSAGGTGRGIWTQFGPDLVECVGNLVEGFSGGGGVGIQNTGADQLIYGYNGVYNCTTKYSITSDVVCDLGDNEELSASPFAKSGSNTFANRFTYFAPVDTGNVRGGAYPSGCRLDKGAVQHADPAGGGGGLFGVAEPVFLPARFQAVGYR